MSEEYSTASRQPITIGYAEDDYVQLKAIVEILEENGFVVAFAVRDGAQLLRVAEQSPKQPDIYITDLKMPGLDGIHAASKIISRWPESKVMILTGETEKCYVDAAKHAGAVAYLNKPVSDKKLNLAIREVYETGKTSIGLINV
ncbi:response regulator transcription factor [Pedobacter frigidisoli]|uniref:response regulator transcription factor n=1 Tax=Pedobacter frigidisoli TaxID=2530455 RepID=UPI00292F3622|nr:response regulator transcription factor [Pedobacter frigidisoli]